VDHWKVFLEIGIFGARIAHGTKLVCCRSSAGQEPLAGSSALPVSPDVVFVHGPSSVVSMLSFMLKRELGDKSEPIPQHCVPLPDTAPEGNIETEIKLMMSNLSMREKFGQMLQLERKDWLVEDLAELVRSHAIGSILSGGGSAPMPNTPQAWGNMVDALQCAALQSHAKIPILYGNDSVHGHCNVPGAVLFPHNVGLGCTRDPSLARRCAEVSAVESRATGVNWIYAPALSVVQDVRWGRTYECFSDDFELVGAMGAAAVQGFQANHTVACAKHWLGDGATTFGTGKGDQKALDCGDCLLSEEILRRTHMRPYVSCLEAGCQTVMASFSSVCGEKMHGHARLLTDVLKGELGFDGILISDWAAVDELAPDGNFYLALIKAVNAGIDVVMLPGIVSWGHQSYQSYFCCMEDAVAQGLIPMSRINDAVSRILRVKARMGLFQKPLSQRGDLECVGCKEHRKIAREAVRKSLVLLQHKGGGVPVRRNSRVLVAGVGANDLGMQCGGWSIEHQGFSGNARTTGTTILAGLRELGIDVVYDPSGSTERLTEGEVAVVVCGEKPYAETAGDVPDYESLFSPQDHQLLLRVKSAKPERRVVLVLLCGRPLPLSRELLVNADSVLVAWLPGTEGAGVADVLCAHDPSGTLAMHWPDESGKGYLYERGHGLTAWFN